MRKIQLSVLLIALCLLFATYAASAKKLTTMCPDCGRPDPRTWRWGQKHANTVSADAEKINWKKVAKKLAGIGQAAGHIGAIKGIFLSEAEADAEFRGAGRWGTPPYVPRSLSDAEDPWRTIYNPNPRPFMLSEAEAEKPNWSKIGKKLAGIGQAAGHLGAIKGLFLSEADAEFGVPSWARPSPYNPNPRPGGFMNDYDVEEFADEEEFDEEDFSINGNIANGGQWSVGGGYNTKIGRGDLSIGGSISNGRNYNVGATFKMPF